MFRWKSLTICPDSWLLKNGKDEYFIRYTIYIIKYYLYIDEKNLQLSISNLRSTLLHMQTHLLLIQYLINIYHVDVMLLEYFEKNDNAYKLIRTLTAIYLQIIKYYKNK